MTAATDCHKIVISVTLVSVLDSSVIQQPRLFGRAGAVFVLHCTVMPKSRCKGQSCNTMCYVGVSSPHTLNAQPRSPGSTPLRRGFLFREVHRFFPDILCLKCAGSFRGSAQMEKPRPR